MRRRALAYALVALLVPLPALALDSDSGEQAAIEVGAALNSCGIVEQRVVCQVDVSYSTVQGASSYEVSITGPDGSVVSRSAGAGGTTVFVPYAGSGSYAVQVVAYGTPASATAKPEKLSSGKAGVAQGEAPAGSDGATGLGGDAPGAQPPPGQAPEPQEPPPAEPEPPDPAEPEAPCEAESEAGQAPQAAGDGDGAEATAEPCPPPPVAP